MIPKVPVSPRVMTEKAREVIARVRPGSTEAHRSLAIRRPVDEVRQVWDDRQSRAAILDGLPVADASLSLGPQLGEWGSTVTIHLRLETAVPGMATQTLAGKALRRLKSLAETGEVPTTERNPSARADAGEETA